MQAKEESYHSDQWPRGPTVIAVSSGKGGTGKSIITASMGYVLAHCGFRTLLIDTDVVTRGLSYYLIADEPYRAQNGFADYVLSDGTGLSESDCLTVRDEFCQSKLFLIPSSAHIRSHTPEPKGLGNLSATLGTKLKRLIRIASADWGFHYVLLDTPGGATDITATVAGLASGYVLVTEADKTSWDVTELLINAIERQAGDTSAMEGVRANRLGFILNKNTLPETDIVKFLKLRFLCKDLAVIPLDIEAVRCFQNDEVPISKSPASQFSEGVVHAVNRLFAVEDEWPEPAQGVLEKLMADIEKRRKEARVSSLLEARGDFLRTVMTPLIIGVIAVIAATFTFFRAEISKEFLAILLIFIAYMASLSAFLANPKAIRSLLRIVPGLDASRKGSDDDRES